MKGKITLLNMMSGIILQFATILSGFIIPKIVLMYFGSEVNGLISSLNQFLSFITLIEGGVTSVVVSNLYKPIVNRDSKKISKIIVTADRFYKKIGCAFACYAVILAICYPVLFPSSLGRLYVFSLTLILSINLLIQYMFSLTLKTILKADKKNYIVNFTQTLIVVANVILSIASVWIYPSVHFLRLISGCLFVFQPIIFGRYVNRNYEVNWNSDFDNSLIKDRWNGFAINLSSFIHSSADITVLTIFSDFKVVSVYGVYSLVSSGLKQLINACVSGILPTIGQAYAKGDFKDLNWKMDLFEYVVFVLVSFLFTVAALLITPFVMIYTREINEAIYYRPAFGVAILIAEAIYLVKIPHMSLAYAANKFREISIPSFVEAGINIFVSIVLVGKFGLIGVAIGTICGMAYRLMFHIYFTTKVIPDRKQRIFYTKFFLFTIASVIGYKICRFLVPLENVTVIKWIWCGCIYSFVCGVILALVSVIFFESEIQYVRKYIRNKDAL